MTPKLSQEIQEVMSNISDMIKQSKIGVLRDSLDNYMDELINMLNPPQPDKTQAK